MTVGPSLLLQFFRSHFCDFQDFAVLAHDVGVVVFLVGNHAVAAILDSIFGVFKITAAFVFQCVQRTVAEQTVEVVRILRFVTGEKFAVFVIDEGEVLSFPVFSHSSTSSYGGNPPGSGRVDAIAYLQRLSYSKCSFSKKCNIRASDESIVDVLETRS